MVALSSSGKKQGSGGQFFDLFKSNAIVESELEMAKRITPENITKKGFFGRGRNFFIQVLDEDVPE